jgi:hypothetical protein
MVIFQGKGRATLDFLYDLLIPLLIQMILVHHIDLLSPQN